MAAVSPAQPDPRITVSRIVSLMSNRFRLYLLMLPAAHSTHHRPPQTRAPHISQRCGRRADRSTAGAPFKRSLSGQDILWLAYNTPMANLALVYGMRLLPADEISSVGEAPIELKNGNTARVTMHLLEGSREQIEAQLRQSIDAFFDFFPEI